MTDKQHLPSLITAIDAVNKQYGKGTVVRLGDTPDVKSGTYINTQVDVLNEALGLPGWPKGCLVEVYGTMPLLQRDVAMLAMRGAQENNGVVAFVDLAHMFNPTRARDLGVSLTKMLVSQPGSAEEALDVAEILIRSGALDLVVIDDVSSLVPVAIVEQEVEDHAGLAARLMSQATRKLCAVAHRYDTCAMFLNHKPDTMCGVRSNTTVGTLFNALKFYCSVRCEFVCVGEAGTAFVRVVKNKLAPPFGCATIHFEEPDPK